MWPSASVQQVDPTAFLDPHPSDRRMAELTFLGTASSQPSKFRNVSGCYVDLFDHGGLLVDCGEDSMGQLKRRWAGTTM